MSDAKSPELESLLRAEIDRAVAPYVDVAPPFMVAKMRELAERYYREHPEASRALQLMAQRQRARSGMETSGEEADSALEASDGKKG